MSKKILVVDDSKTALMMEREIVERRTTYQCVTASDGMEAVEKAQQEQPDLVLMDVVMPRMNGFEACKKMRQQPGRARFPLFWSPLAARNRIWRLGFKVDATTTSRNLSMAQSWWLCYRAIWVSRELRTISFSPFHSNQ